MEPQKGEFVQVLNVGRNHWVTISFVSYAPNYVRVYDSLHLRLSSTTKKIVPSIMHCTGEHISIEYCNVQCPSGARANARTCLEHLSLSSICRLPDDGEPMIQSSKYSKWVTQWLLCGTQEVFYG